MIDKKNILKMAEHVFHRSQGYPDRRLIHPQRDWAMGVGMFVVLVVIGSILAGNVFVTYRHVEDTHSDLVETVPKYKEVIVGTALTEQRIRTQEYKRLRESRIPVVVPEVASSTASSTHEVLEEERVQEGLTGAIELSY